MCLVLKFLLMISECIVAKTSEGYRRHVYVEEETDLLYW